MSARFSLPELEREVAARAFAVMHDGCNSIVLRTASGWTVKCAREEASVAKLEREARFAPLVARAAGLRCPTYVYLGLVRGAAFPLCAISRWITGTPLSPRCVDSASAEVFLALGEALGRFHQAPPPVGLPERPDHPAWYAGQARRAARLAACPTAFDSAARRAIDVLAVAAKAEARQTLIHGDLKPEHLIRSGEGPLTILDLGELRVDDPAIDFAAMRRNFDATAYAAFASGYARVVPPPRHRRIAEFDLLYGLELAISAILAGDALLAARSTVELEHSLGLLEASPS